MNSLQARPHIKVWVRTPEVRSPKPRADASASCDSVEGGACPNSDFNATPAIKPASATQPNWFASTHWSVVLAAGESHLPDGGTALEELCRTYWKPLFAFARVLGHSEHDAQDLTQGFFEHFLQKGYIRAADPRRGRFRSFLLT